MISTKREDYNASEQVRLLMPVRVGDRSFPPGFYKIKDLPDYAFKRKMVYQYKPEETSPNPPTHSPVKTIQPPQ